MTQDFHPMQSPQRQPGIESKIDPAPEYMPRYQGSGRLKGKVALITGGDSGIGRATAILYAREGANVAIVYKDEEGDAEKTKDLIEEEGAQVLLIPGDIGEKSFCKSAVKQTIDAFGQLDILVNNAGEQHAQDTPEDIEEAQIERTFRTNIFGTIFMTQEALPHLKTGSRIICLTSITAYKGQDLLIDYASTKGAILAFLRAMASKLAPEGILVNGVAPGPIWTPLIPASFPKDAVEDFGQDSPLGRPGQPNEVAPALLFLACEDSSYMTGQVLHPNGGTLVGG
ncbi:SDR family oxidoreductase [Pararhodobacter oceanensis]|uniref:NAD(P)-dependent oxidoreductase n=1 Tax=Pararhodobacter oceanensis TaxID=2172121 RepID=A0A2T8HPV6_9RHOB|nr:SDR family oxidoreductase [Pararhodobacter oceanensis]PVH27450.1 NAD(P)-dependent oxidoreductase [Pararhodobacter oceanensis]